MLRTLFPLSLLLWAGTTLSAPTDPDSWQVPVARKVLPNGLTVLVSPDPSSPTIGLSVVYKVGMRLEPKNRTGFAHLFEHLMFQGTPKAPKGVYDRVVTGGGGDNNGSTRADFTNYIVSAPASALNALLWLEADRMKTLDFSADSLKNQQDVVKEEIRVNVQNKPYGAVMWIDIGTLAFDKWENQHDGYGSFKDLETASLDDVRAFHRDYYGPNNAVLSIAGDITPQQGFKLAQKYFGGIAARPVPKGSDFSEGLNAAERRLTQQDPLAKLPALTLGWKMPDRGSKDQAAFAVLGELLAGGDASRFYLGLVKGRELSVSLSALYGLTSVWEYDGPSLWTVFAVYKQAADAAAVVQALDEEIARVAQQGVDAPTLARLKTRLKAAWYNRLENFTGRADLLARLQAIWGDANVVNRIPEWIEAVTSADVQRAATTYLTPANRAVIDRVPAAGAQ